jgi:UDPglucose 6-dehydrogenase
MKVAVLGLGVGYALACCLAEAGYTTIGVDINPKVVAKPRKDPSLKKLLGDKSVFRRIKKNLTLTTDYASIRHVSVAIVCVSTGDDKKLVLGHVEEAVRQALRELRVSPAKQPPLLMVYSTLPFGSSQRVREIFHEEEVELDRRVGYVYFPLMIAQGTTASDFVNPPFVVFGSDDLHVAKRAMTFYKNFLRKSTLYSGREPPMFLGIPEEAELSKLAANALLTTKIAVANEIGRLCEKLGLDGQKIMQTVGSDWRIGRKFTKPGFAAGGQCFPRDLKSLIETFESYGVNPKILQAVDQSNELRKLDPLDKIQGLNVIVLGTSYKSGVKIESGSPAIDLMEGLESKGFTVESYDPKFNDSGSMRAKLRDQDTAIVTIAEDGFRELGRNVGDRLKVVLDYADIVDEAALPLSVALWKAGRGWLRQRSNAPA